MPTKIPHNYEEKMKNEITFTSGLRYAVCGVRYRVKGWS
jgi:hypothetical protein